jgi:hypothetical protein
MEAMQAEPVDNGQQPMTSADVIFKVLCLYQASLPPRQAKKSFLKNFGILRSSTRAETSVEMTLRE